MVHVSTQQEFSDADWRAVATADQSKKLKLLLSGLTTGTTRVLTIPDADGTIMLTSAIGVTVQAYDADLASWAAVTRASGFDTFTATPSSANLRSLLTDETGTGIAVFNDTPTLVTPVLGAATATSIAVGGGVAVTKIDAGTYTPTLFNTTNVGASTAYVTNWRQVGNTVWVWGRVDIDATTTTTNTILGLSIPVASNFAATDGSDAGGTALAFQITFGGLTILSDDTNDRVSFRGVVQSAANLGYFFSFAYKVI